MLFSICSKRVLLWALPILAFGFLAAEGRAQSPQTNLYYEATAVPHKAGSDYVELVLAAASTTARPVLHAQIGISRCEFGQQTAFQLKARTRRLVPGEERLRFWDHAQWGQWYIPTLSTPRFLRLQFKLPTNKGGPTFCVHVWSFADKVMPDRGVEVVWHL